MWTFTIVVLLAALRPLVAFMTSMEVLSLGATAIANAGTPRCITSAKPLDEQHRSY